MHIVIPGALPHTRIAHELIPYLVKDTPELTRLFQKFQARKQQINLLEAACTCAEYWELHHLRGFKPNHEQNMSSGLAALHEPDIEHANTPVWVAELVHMSPSRDGAALLPADQLNITQEESLALFNTAQSVFESYGHHAQFGKNPSRWVLTLPENLKVTSSSPQLVAQTRVNDWWPQDANSRPWRQLVNELQMSWHEHPVNQARYQQGEAPINSIWLYGGATTSQLCPPTESADQWYPELAQAFQSEDWGQWLAQLKLLETTVLNTLNTANHWQLVLLGNDRIVTLSPGLPGRLRALLPGNRQHWRRWWSPQN